MATAEGVEQLRTEFKSKNQSAFVLGYTGETGKVLVEEILTSGVFSQVVLIGRRVVEFKDNLYKDVEQRVIDFEKLEDHKDAFNDFDQGFNCMGTTRGKAGSEGFYKVDHDYVVNTAQLAKNAGCKHMHLLTSMGANKNAWVLYSKTKGEVEEEVKAMDFDRLSIYRPGVIMCKREESRPAEAVLRVVLKPIDYLFPGTTSNQVTDIAKAMVNQACTVDADKVSVFEGRGLYKMAGHGGCKKSKDKTSSEGTAEGGN